MGKKKNTNLLKPCLSRNKAHFGGPQSSIKSGIRSHPGPLSLTVTQSWPHSYLYNYQKNQKAKQCASFRLRFLDKI